MQNHLDPLEAAFCVPKPVGIVPFMEIKNSTASLGSVKRTVVFLKGFIFKIYKNNIFYIFLKIFLILIK